MKSKKITFTTLFMATSLLYSGMASADRIKEIKVLGNQRIENETIINYLKIKKGEDFSSDREKESIKELYKTNLFSEIKLKENNGIVEVFVKEVPLVISVDFRGNNRIKSTSLTKEILTHKGSSLSDANIKMDVEKIKEIYRKTGRYAIEVVAKIEDEGSNRAKVIFDISEGPKTAIRYINFVGNRNYKDSELRSVILTRQSAWFRFLDTSDVYDPDRIDYDKYLLKRFYGSLGYANFRVISSVAELSQTKENFTLTYTIEEGDKYNFGAINIASSIEGIDANEFAKYIKISEGNSYNSVEVENICELISDKLADIGYTGAAVYPEEVKDKENKTVSITFQIEKGSKTNIGKINIFGNVKTIDNVIRRQFKINEGDLYNRSAVNKAEQNIRNLDYFETVSVETEPSETGQNKADINVKVEEKSTSSIQFEVGYNSVEGPVGRVNFTERNLLGTGRYLNAGVDKYRKKISYHMGLTDPYFMDKDLLAGISVFKLDSRGSGETPYNIKSFGSSLRFGYDLDTDLRHDVIYTLKKDELFGGSVAKSVYVAEQYGSKVTSSVANSLTLDKTDSIIVPKNGYIVSATETVAGVGGDTKFFKHEADFKAFKSFFNNDITLKFAGEIGKIQGYGGEKIKISDRFFLGDFSLRGFESSGIGPRDKRTREALGGQNFYSFSTELLFPIGFPKEFNVSGSLFTDVGALWGFDAKTLYTKNDVYNSMSPRVSIGTGIVWVTRIAPIRLDYAIPIKKEKYDQTQRWHFRFSTSF